MEVHLICRETQIAEREIEIRVGPVDEGFQPSVVLLTVGESTSHDGHMVTLF